MSFRRREDHRLITGTGHYVADLVEPDDLHVSFYRSPIAHGVLTGIDVDRARQGPGVIEVLTHDDIDLLPIPGGHLAPPGFERPVLATGKVRYVGEPIAAVVADSPALAADAASQIWAEIDGLDVVTDPRSSLNGPDLFEEGNLVGKRTVGSEPTDRKYEISATVSMRNQRLAPASLEGLAIRANPTADGGLVTHCGHQAPHRLKQQISDQLQIDVSKVRVIVPDVGGAFGLKGMLFPEYLVTCAAALRLGRPVVWIEERREHFLSGVHGRAQDHEVTLEGDRDGRIRRANIRILADVGAYPHNGALIPSLTTFVSQGLYEIEELSVEATTVVTNLAPTGSYRGAGRPEAAFAMERAVDAFAREVDLDPAEVRMINFIETTQLPFTTHTTAIYDSGDYRAALEKALDLIDMTDVRAEQQRRREQGHDPIGVGIGAFVERAGGALGVGEFGEVEIREDGAIEVRTGSTSAGQGHETVWAQVVSDVFGVDPSVVEVVAGDTGRVEDGVGTYASRSAQIGASAAQRTGSEVLARAKAMAADMLEARSDDMVVEAGRVHVTGDPESGLSLGDLASHAREIGEPLRAAEMFVPEAQTFPFGAHVALVEVSLETGEVKVLQYVAVDDCGEVLNPMIVEGQVVGSLAQGFGQAVLEGIEYAASGDPLTASFMDYLIPAAMDVPSFTLGRTVSPAPSNPLGVKGTGEAGCIGAPPAIVNATIDALSYLGVTDLSMPLRPHRVWDAIQRARFHR
ncbi:MAG TPA: xanthine dehydrogenase family protein molybdopterin-binding subunit [Acidimicrobiia bacterium]|nr:xanthine dehydrogenase family protein molybdopterin-binding subunit [Acidimicrobiia bacterium]